MQDCPIIRRTDKVELVKRIQEQERTIHDLMKELRHIRKDRDYYKNDSEYYKGLYFKWRSTIDAGH